MLLVLPLLLLLKSQLSLEIMIKSFFIGITLEDTDLDWLNCFLPLVFSGILLLILIGFMLFFSPFLDLIMMPMSTVKQLGRGIIFQQDFSFNVLLFLFTPAL